MPEQRQKTIVCFCKRSCGGSPWRDLPPAFGHWNSQFRRFRRWSKSGVCEGLFKAVSEALTLNILSLMALSSGSTRRRAVQKGPQHQAIGRSRGGLTTKIVALVDALGNLVRFLLLPGQAHDMKGVAPLIKGVSFDALLADKAFDADWLLQDLDERGATAVIPPKTNRKIQRNYDAEVYKWRHLVENYFAKIKEFRGIATRYDKTDCSYAACWNLVAALIAAR